MLRTATTTLLGARSFLHSNGMIHFVCKLDLMDFGHILKD